MCGIVGYVGSKEIGTRLIEGLKRLEYRGYDSSGLSVIENKKLEHTKRVGRVKTLEAALPRIISKHKQEFAIPAGQPMETLLKKMRTPTSVATNALPSFIMVSLKTIYRLSNISNLKITLFVQIPILKLL